MLCHLFYKIDSKKGTKNIWKISEKFSSGFIITTNKLREWGYHTKKSEVHQTTVPKI